MADFTRVQVEELEDVILNALSPIHAKLQMMQMGKQIHEKDVQMMIGRIEKVAEYIRSLHKVPVFRR